MTTPFNSFVGALPTATSANSADSLYILQGGQSKQVSPQAINLGLRQFLVPGPGDAAGTRRFYVATTGSDTTGDGTSGNPWATVQWAYNQICAFWAWTVAGTPNTPTTFATVFQEAIIQLADGTYTQNQVNNAGAYLGVTPSGIANGQAVVIQGNQSDASKVIWQNPTGSGAIGFWIDGGPVMPLAFDFNHITFKGWSTAVQMTYGAYLYCHDNNWDTTHTNNGTDIAVFQPMATLFYYSNNKITGNRSTHIYSESFADMSFGSTVTLVGTPNFTGQFININGGKTNGANDMGFVGSATGKRFNVDNGGNVFVGGSQTFFPGNAAGTIAGGGIYR